MTIVNVNLSSITVPHMDEYTSGASNSFFVKFNFSDEWNDLTKLVTFKCADISISQILDGNTIAIPHEVLLPKQKIFLGVLGTMGETVVLPTIWKELREVKFGVAPGIEPQDPTPSVYQQIFETANSVREDADNGAFNGASVIAVEITDDNHFRCMLSNGRVLDAGKIPMLTGFQAGYGISIDDGVISCAFADGDEVSY